MKFCGCVTDHVTVLRDGRVVGSGPTPGFSRGDLVRLIVGHDIVATTKAEPVETQTCYSSRCCSGFNRALAFETSASPWRPGRSLGCSGLIGSGFAEIGPMLIGRGVRPERPASAWHSTI